MVVIYNLDSGDVLASGKPCDLNLSGIFKHLMGGALCNDLALVQYYKVVTELEHLITVVGHQN